MNVQAELRDAAAPSNDTVKTESDTPRASRRLMLGGSIAALGLAVGGLPRLSSPAAAQSAPAAAPKGPQFLDFPGKDKGLVVLGDRPLVAGRRPQAAAAAARLLERYVAAGENGLAIVLDEEVGETLADVLPARFFLAAASARERAGDDDGAWRVLEGLVARSPKDPASVRAALKMAGFARRAGMTPEALDLLDWGRSHPACEPGFREAASRAEEELLRTSHEPPGARRSLPVRRFAAWGEPRAFPAH